MTQMDFNFISLILNHPIISNISSKSNPKSPLLLSLSLSLCLSLTLNAQDKPLVVSSASIFADMASAIGGNLIESTTIVPIGGDPHIYEPTPGDVRLLLKADLILQNGLTFEGWIRDLIQNSGSKAPVHTLTEGIEPVRSELHQNAVDPHAWMDPVNGKTYARNIRNALLQLLPEYQDAINLQYEQYIRQLDSLDHYVRQQIGKIDTSKRILITSHDAFQYYGRRYGLQLESVLGTSTDADVRTSDLIRLNQVIRQHNVPAVFIESTINPKLLYQVAADNNIAIGGKLYSDSIGDKDSPAPTYIDMIRHNTDVIVAGLTSSPVKPKMEPAANNMKSLNTIIFVTLGLIAMILGFILFRNQRKRA